LAFNALTRWLYRGHAASAVAHLWSGHAIQTNVHDHDGRILHLFGIGDIKVAELTEGLLRPGDCFFDIGANYGSIGFLAARRVGPAGQVHFIEPQPQIAAALREAIELDEAGLDVQVHEAAASDHEGKMTLHCAPHHTGVATLEPSSSSRRDWTPITIPVLNIASLLERYTADRDFGVKLDIEGHEPTVLPILLGHPRCRFVIFEACNNATTLFDISTRASCVVFGLRRTYLWRRLRRISRPSDLLRHHDAIAVPLQRFGSEPPLECSFTRFARLLG
jgi:FkbM family methyltransferase